jgi:hypothetical protein
MDEEFYLECWCHSKEISYCCMAHSSLVCSSFSEGGLGIRSLSKLNQANNLKFWLDDPTSNAILFPHSPINYSTNKLMYTTGMTFYSSTLYVIWWIAWPLPWELVIGFFFKSKGIWSGSCYATQHTTPSIPYYKQKKSIFFLSQIINKSNLLSSFLRFTFTYSHKIQYILHLIYSFSSFSHNQ